MNASTGCAILAASAGYSLIHIQNTKPALAIGIVNFFLIEIILIIEVEF